MGWKSQWMTNAQLKVFAVHKFWKAGHMPPPVCEIEYNLEVANYNEIQVPSIESFQFIFIYGKFAFKLRDSIVSCKIEIDKWTPRICGSWRKLSSLFVTSICSQFNLGNCMLPHFFYRILTICFKRLKW